MGNLPRSRPGRRSDKRASGKAAASGGGAKAKGGSKASARSTKASAGGAGQTRKPKAASSRTGAARPPREQAKAPQQPAKGPDPLGDAVRVAAKVAGAGMGVAAGILRRLPRP